MSESMSSLKLYTNCVKRMAIEFFKDSNYLLQSLLKSNELFNVLHKREDNCYYCLCESDVKHFHWILSENEIIYPFNDCNTAQPVLTDTQIPDIRSNPFPRMPTPVKTLSQIYSKDSFDRFGDDLCEVLLSYLSFEEKVRFECLSKQFRSCGLQSQRKLNINNNSMKIIKCFPIYFIRLMKEMTAIESILRKCPNITSIDISTEVTNRREVFKLIVKYCPNLTQIRAQFGGLTQNTINLLFNKFGSKLKKITLISHNMSTKEGLKLCPNLNRLSVDNLLSDKFFNDIHKYFPKLQHIHCSNTVLSNEKLKSLSKLSDLKTIYFNCNYYIYKRIDDSVVLGLIKSCLKIKSIYAKNYSIYIELNERQISELRGNDCKNLEIIHKTFNESESSSEGE